MHKCNDVFDILLESPMITLCTGCGKKVASKSFLMVSQQPFGILIWNFTVLFLHLTAMQNVISLKTDEVIDFNVTTYRFFSIKKCSSYVHQCNNIVEATQLTNESDARISLSLWMFEVFTISFKLQHKLSVAYFDKSFTALLIGPCGRLPQITWSVSLTLAIVSGFVLNLQHCTPHAIVHWVYIRQIWRSLVHCDEIWTVGLQPFRALRAVCAGAPSCWKMNPVGSRRLL